MRPHFFLTVYDYSRIIACHVNLVRHKLCPHPKITSVSGWIFALITLCGESTEIIRFSASCGLSAPKMHMLTLLNVLLTSILLNCRKLQSDRSQMVSYDFYYLS